MFTQHHISRHIHTNIIIHANHYTQWTNHTQSQTNNTHLFTGGTGNIWFVPYTLFRKINCLKSIHFKTQTNTFYSLWQFPFNIVMMPPACFHIRWHSIFVYHSVLLTISTFFGIVFHMILSYKLRFFHYFSIITIVGPFSWYLFPVCLIIFRQ